LPFVAVKLHPIEQIDTIDDRAARSARYIFIRVDGTLKAFCYNSPTAEDAAPSWFPLLADKKGVLGEGFTFDVLMPEIADEGVMHRPAKATIVAQLRYEYALNLVQRLGGTLTRIGLDYV
jgi:hypothetical protein